MTVFNDPKYVPDDSMIELMAKNKLLCATNLPVTNQAIFIVYGHSGYFLVKNENFDTKIFNEKHGITEEEVGVMIYKSFVGWENKPDYIN